MTSRADPKTEFFPGANPHPVMRVSDDGELIYANAASAPLLDELGLRVGAQVPSTWLERIQSTAGPVDVRVGPRTFELLPVRLPDLASRTSTERMSPLSGRSPSSRPEPKPGVPDDDGGRLVYVNRAAQDDRGSR